MDLRQIEWNRDDLIEGTAADPKANLNLLLRTIKPGDPPEWIRFVFTGAFIYRVPVDGNPGEEEWQISDSDYTRDPGDWDLRIRFAERQVVSINLRDNK